jgi:hypothetical protein
MLMILCLLERVSRSAEIGTRGRSAYYPTCSKLGNYGDLSTTRPETRVVSYDVVSINCGHVWQCQRSIDMLVSAYRHHMQDRMQAFHSYVVLDALAPPFPEHQ